MPTQSSEMAATVSIRLHPRGVLTVTIGGRLDIDAVGPIWREVMGKLEGDKPKQVVVDASGIAYCDGAGATLFAEMEEHAGGAFEVRSLSPEFHPLLELYTKKGLTAPATEVTRVPFVEQVGRAAAGLASNLYRHVSFVGELFAGLLFAVRYPKRVPWKDTIIIAETAGANAFPIIILIGFLLGLIMAFQSAVPMQQFGAEIFVADLVGISMIKVLGPLMTAIVLAGRSGSAFAAEIGMMKVNEEIDALTTMGIDPVRYLVVTRGIALVLMTPLLTLFCSFFALCGGAIVVMSMGYPLVTYIDRIVGVVSLGAFLSGVLKSFVFGILVGGVGCLRGLTTGTGAKAVGDSTTSAVVSGIVLIAVTEAIFAVVLYALGI
ncbi:MAG: ABC transporter permease [Planctomycetota bacterium]|nr:ABC transporter permease [Planctomycetota bacterium]